MRRQHLITVVAVLAGLALFGYSVQRAGVTEIAEGIRRIGYGLVLILAIGGTRFLVRAQCWRLCASPGTRLTLTQAFSAFLAGDAVGTVTPLGLLASEPTKIFLTRHQLATGESVASLALENLVYAISVATMVGLGLLVVLSTVPVPAAWRWGGAAGALALVVTAAAALRLLRADGLVPVPAGSRWRSRVATVLGDLHHFSTTHPSRLWRAYALDLVYHALAVAEVFVTLEWLLGGASPTVAQAIVFEALNRVVTVLFKFVPFRVGIDEALAGALAQGLALNPAAGVALAVVRKVRGLFWAAVGLLIVFTHPARRSS